QRASEAAQVEIAGAGVDASGRQGQRALGNGRDRLVRAVDHQGGNVEIVCVADSEVAAGERDRSLEVVAGPRQGDVGRTGIDDRGPGDEGVGGLGDRIVAGGDV